MGYTAVWRAGGLILTLLALALKLAAGSSIGLLLAVAGAAVWQASPAKQACLNRRHHQPPLAAFGRAADLDALKFGLANGLWCVGACWALMVVPLMATRGHLLAMAACGTSLIAEHLERPAPLACRWRWPAKPMRIVVVQARRRLGPVAR